MISNRRSIVIEKIYLNNNARDSQIISRTKTNLIEKAKQANLQRIEIMNSRKTLDTLLNMHENYTTLSPYSKSSRTDNIKVLNSYEIKNKYFKTSPVKKGNHLLLTPFQKFERKRVENKKKIERLVNKNQNNSLIKLSQDRNYLTIYSYRSEEIFDHLCSTEPNLYAVTTTSYDKTSMGNCIMDNTLNKTNRILKSQRERVPKSRNVFV